MTELSHDEAAILLLSLGILLGVARLLGELALRFRQPAVLGELFAGVLLGPTVMGAVAPGWSQFLFPETGAVPMSLSALTTVGITLFLLVAGMEVDLSTVWRQGRAAVSIGLMGIVAPFALGFAAAWYFPVALGAESGSDHLLFTLFFATALSISALPVIAKTLMDLNLFRTDFGMVIVAAAILNDLVGWIIFAIILSLMGEYHEMPIGYTVGLTIGFVVLMLTVGRWLLDRGLPWVQAHSSWPGGVLGFALTAALLSAALTAWIGIHAIFGAFLFGVALGDSRHLRERTRATIEQFVSFVFAPLFFASVGLRGNFIEDFDLPLVVTVLVLATVGKVFACGWGARWSGFSRRESWAAGVAMNSRGVMEIILGLLALQVGLIGERLFVALVIMALVTSMVSGGLIQFCLRRKKPRRFSDFLNSKSSYCKLAATDREGAIREMVRCGCGNGGLDPDLVAQRVLGRERIAPTSLEFGVAVPHSRLEELQQPIVVIGLSDDGIDWDSTDGEPATVIVMLLTPSDDGEVQIELLADIAKTFHDARLVRLARETRNYTEFLACVKIDLRPQARKK